MTASIAADLRARISGSLVTDPDLLPGFGEDFLENRGTPAVVVRPAHAEDVSATLRYAAERGIALVPRAAGTNVAAAFLPTPERIMLDLRGLNRILVVDHQARRAVVQPGVINGDLNAHLATHGLFYAPDPASAAISSIGGNLATNAGGIHCLKYGVTVHHVQAATWVLPDGHTLSFDAADAGPDLPGVLIGSEGTLGIVTEATVRLTPIPAVTRTLLAVFDRTEDAVEAVSATIAAGLVPAAMEYWERAVTEIIEAYEPTGYPTDAAAILLVDLDGDLETVADELRRVAAILGRTEVDAAVAGTLPPRSTPAAAASTSATSPSPASTSPRSSARSARSPRVTASRSSTSATSATATSTRPRSTTRTTPSPTRPR
jgi:glycolate oxidase